MDTNIIYCGDNLDVLPKYIPDESVNLIYIDPPFNSSRNYEVFWGEAQERRAFEDRFGDVMHYLEWMRPRLRELHRVLKSSGSFYYHCDWHASHYIKMELDRVFGFDNFQNEVIWKRTTGHRDSHKWNQAHDTLLFYSKSSKFIWNAQYEPYDEEYIKANFRPDENGRLFMADNLLAAGIRHGESGMPWHGIDPTTTGNHWQYAVSKLDQLDAAGRIYWPKKTNGMPRIKRYLDELDGRPITSVWTDIPAIGAHAKERLGYPTQKPVTLLERTIHGSSNEGDVVLDAFCGCGTTLEAAAKLKRKWIGIDYSPTACRVMSERLEVRLGLKEGVDFILKDMPKTAEQLRKMPPFEFQNWAVVALGGIPNKVKVGDYGIDGRLYLADMVKEQKSVVYTAGKSETVGQRMFETLDKWYPIQVKQVDKAGRPDIDKFETAMRRDKRLKGYFIAFGFTQDAMHEIKRAQTAEGLEIVPITVDELLAYEKTALS